MRTLFLLLVASGLFPVGCDPVASRSVFLRGSQAAVHPGDAATVAVSGVSASDVATAVGIVEGIAVAHGLHRDRRYSNVDVIDSFVGQNKPDGSTPLCYVYHHKNNGVVEVRFDEWARFSSSDLARSMQQDVFTAFVRRFGAGRISTKA